MNSNVRPAWDSCFSSIAREIAKMGTCSRRLVGCVLVDVNRRILSTGVNGPPPGWSHCRYEPGAECPGAKSPSGTNLDQCVANHAEANALIYCQDAARIHTVYCTTSPCVSCVKMLLCTGACRIVFEEEYPHKESRELWCRGPATSTDRRGKVEDHRTWELFNPEMGKALLLDSSGFKR